MNYRIDYDGYYTTINRTACEQPNGYDVFHSFPAAKKVALDYARYQRDEWAEAVSRLYHLKASDLEVK